MSNEFRLRCNAHGVRDRPFVLSRDAEFSRCSEAQAATAIQSHWRAFIVRKNVKHLANACCVIQSGFRGFRGRKRACQLQAQASATCREGYFCQAALEIQRQWRGYMSRKLVHCYSVREQYLIAVGDDGRRYRRELTNRFENKVRCNVFSSCVAHVSHQ